MKTWEQHYQDMEKSTALSANVAEDYLVGQQIKHLKNLLDDTKSGIKDWEIRGVIPIVNNITKKVVERSAKSYATEPKRTVMVGGAENEKMTDYYNRVLSGEGNSYIEAMDIYSRLLKVTLMLVQFVEDTQEYSFTVLHRGNSSVSYNEVTRKVESLMYTSNMIGPNGERMYHHWTDLKITDIEVDKFGKGRVSFSQDNKFGIIPVAVLRDIGKPLTGFWPETPWEELIRLNEAVNMFATEFAFASKFQAFPSTVTNTKIASGQVSGVDSIVEIDTAALGDTPVFYELTSPNVNLDNFKDAFADLAEQIADNWGVKMEIGGSATADSGFQLIVQENNSLETRVKRIKTARQFEQELFNVIATIDSTLKKGPLTPAMEIQANFAEPSLAVDIAAESERMRLDYAAGLISKRDWWKWKDPDLTPEQLDAKVNEGKALPNFDSQVN